MAWNEERRASKTPERFGAGEPAGVAAPEAANNACVGAAMIPLLALGIPGSASTAVLLGGLTVQGVAPGPLLMTERSSLVYALYAGFLVSVALLLVVGRLGIPLWLRVVRLRPSVLMPLVVAISLTGAFALRGNLADAWFALGFGLVGFAMLRRGYPLAPAVLGLVLGPMVETNYRRALALIVGLPLRFRRESDRCRAPRPRGRELSGADPSQPLPFRKEGNRVSATAAVTDFILDTSIEDLPAELLVEGRRCVTDGVGVMLAGAAETCSRIVREQIEEQGGRPEAAVFGGSGSRAPASLAARANGTAGHAMDFDDTQLSNAPDRIFGLLTHPTVARSPPPSRSPNGRTPTGGGSSRRSCWASRSSARSPKPSTPATIGRVSIRPPPSAPWRRRRRREAQADWAGRSWGWRSV